MAADDARIIERELDGIEIDDLINLDDFEMYVKSSVDGQRQPTFSLRLNPPPPPDDHAATLMRASCRERYGTPVARVDAQINEAIEEHMEFVREAEDAVTEAETKKAAAKQTGKTTKNTTRRTSTNAKAPAPTAQPPLPAPSPPLPTTDTPSEDATPKSGKPTRRSGKAAMKRRDPVAWHGEQPQLVQGQLAPARVPRDADEDGREKAEDANREEAEA